MSIEVVTPGVNHFPAPRSDAEKAEDARARLRPVLEEVCRILTEVKRDGIVVTFNITTDQYGIYRLMALDVIKPL